ncbi:hypothetical protein, partial [Blastomonas sp.]|uniref:hypothetical protein n=1 Tax=Blastomonas sp. TaxID=1909299 RepID=UPI0035938274
MLKLTFIDTESCWDEHLHDAYREVDPRGCAEFKRKHPTKHRQASKRIFAAAAFDIAIDDAGAVSIEGMHSWTEHSHGSEMAVVEALFDHVRFRPDHKAVTYSGLSADLPLLTLAAMEYNLTLPDQLRTGHRPRPGDFRPHLDLALELKGAGRDWAHMSEIGLRMGLPGALFANKTAVEYPSSAAEWQAVRQHVERDVLLTAMITFGWLPVQG